MEGRWSVCFFVLVSNHYISIVLFLWSSSTYNTHINKSGQDSHTKTFSELYQFRSRLEARSYQLLYKSAFTNYFTICLKIFTIHTTNQIFLMEKKKWIMLNCQRTFTLNSPIVIVTVVVLPFVNAIVIVTVSLLKIFHGKSYLPKTNILLCFLVSFKT